jgi:uncharacterized protein YjdB
VFVRRFTRLAAILSIFIIAACSDGGLFSPNQNKGDRAQLSLRPYFSVAGAHNSADINLVRLTVTVLPSGPTFVVNQSVDPNAQSWDLPVEVPPNSEVSVLVELINVAPGGAETVQFSGRLPVIRVTSGPQPPPPPVPVFPGPPSNLGITSVTISPRDQSVLEGATVNLSAAVQGSTNPSVFWSSSDPTIATVNANGVVNTLRPGAVTITAQAGPKTDNVNITVGARAASIEIVPANVTLTSINQEVVFTGRVLDPRNAVVPGVAIVWSIADATVAAQGAPGVFRALKNGSTTVTATATQAGNTITATTGLVVEQRAVTISVSPATRFFDALGATEQFTVEAKDANGQPVQGSSVTWTSTNPNVASVNSSGLVTSVGNGTATIRAQSGQNAAEAQVTVQQRVASVTASPNAVVLTFIGDEERVTAQARDARGNVMNVPINWFSQNPAIAGAGDGVVSANGDGRTIVFADVNGVRAAISVTVQRVATQIVLDKPSLNLNAGSSQQVNAQLADEGGYPLPTQPTFTWTTSNANVAVVSSTGLVTGLNAGQATITAAAHGFTRSLPVTVVGTAPSGALRANSNGKVLLVEADGQASFVEGQLVATGFFTAANIDAHDMFYEPPPLSTLTQYGAIMVWTNYSPSYPVAWGDRLKEYVDAGGKVVMAVYAYSNLNDPWDLQGGIMSAGYSPLVNTNNRYDMGHGHTHSLDFATALTTHAVLAGVTDFVFGGNSNYTRPTLAPGATLIGRDNEGVPTIAINATGSVIGFNLYPGNAFSKSPGVWKAIANALR